MSRIGKQPVAIPEGVTVEVDGSVVRVKGKNAELTETMPHGVIVSVNDSEVAVEIKHSRSDIRANWGLARALIANMVVGVTEGYEKKLEINGVGYGAQMKGKDIELKVGFSHPVSVKAVEGIEFAIDGNVITVKGASKQQVGQMAAEIRKVRKPEPYKGKGIKYIDEIVRRKAGKVVKAAGE